MEVKKITLRDRKKAQPKAVVFFSDQEKKVIRDTVGKSLSDPQFNVFMYTCQALGLNPLLNEIACVTYRSHTTGETSMSIQVMRDGFLTVAHRSSKFAGLESGVYEKGDKKIDGLIASERTGWAKAYHKDFQVPVYQEADFSEYNAPTKGGKPTLWASKPKTMIKKVAEAMALRKAFNINGVYAPEEMDREIIGKEVKDKVVELDEKSLSKISKAKDLNELIEISKKIKEEKGIEYQQAILNAYNERKEQLK